MIKLTSKKFSSLEVSCDISLANNFLESPGSLSENQVRTEHLLAEAVVNMAIIHNEVGMNQRMDCQAGRYYTMSGEGSNSQTVFTGLYAEYVLT